MYHQVREINNGKQMGVGKGRMRSRWVPLLNFIVALKFCSNIRLTNFEKAIQGWVLGWSEHPWEAQMKAKYLSSCQSCWRPGRSSWLLRSAWPSTFGESTTNKSSLCLSNKWRKKVFLIRE